MALKRGTLVRTVKDTVTALIPRLTSKNDSGHLDQMRAHYARARRRLDALAGSERTSGPLHPQTVAAAIDRLASDDAVLLADVGSPVVWAARYLTMNGRRRLVGPFNHATMANALPEAIGVQASHADRQVVTLSGDGGIAMMFGELLTLRQLALPVKVVVFNNGSLAFVDLEMKAAGTSIMRPASTTRISRTSHARSGCTACGFSARMSSPERYATPSPMMGRRWST
jgi:pyruvate dehydrogenase (quinone)